MSFDIIHDVEKGISALIDPAAGRALGPILQSAEHGVELLETFVGGINQDPSTMHPADLERLFRDFIQAIAEPEPGAVVEPPANPVADPAPGVAAVPEPAAAEVAAQAPESALPGQTGAVAGPVGGTEQAVAAGGQQVDVAAAGVVADGGLPTGIEQAAPAGEAPQPSPEQAAREAGEQPAAAGEPATGEAPKA